MEFMRRKMRKRALLIIAVLQNFPQLICFFYDTFYIGNRMTTYQVLMPIISIVLFARAFGLEIGGKLQQRFAGERLRVPGNIYEDFRMIRYSSPIVIIYLFMINAFVRYFCYDQQILLDEGFRKSEEEQLIRTQSLIIRVTMFLLLVVPLYCYGRNYEELKETAKSYKNAIIYGLRTSALIFTSFLIGLLMEDSYLNFNKPLNLFFLLLCLANGLLY